MNRLFYGVVTCLVALLALASCASSDNSPLVDLRPQVDSTEQALPAKIVLTLSNGHLHGLKNFHYVPSGGVFQYQDIQNAQSFTFVRSGESWQLDPQSLQRFIGYQTIFYSPGQKDSAKPDYGAVLRLYDGEGKLINESYAGEGVRDGYQFFASLSDGRAWDGSTIATASSDQSALLNYVYCDTNVWDKSASKSPRGADGKPLYYFLPDSEPLGIKGYYQFLQLGQYTLNIDLWHSPAGKLEAGVASPFYQPNGTVQQGRRLLRLQLPVSIFASPAFFDDLIEAIEEDYDDRIASAQTDAEREALKRHPLSWEKTPAALRPEAERLVRLLGASSWEAVQEDFLQYYQNPGNEQTPDGYF